jgi:type II secretory pathway pseudopilin PulG
MGKINDWKVAGREETGASLVESLVAIALLLTVLVPMTGALTTVIGRRMAERQTLALAVARRHLETLLGAGDAVPTDSSVASEGEWMVQKVLSYDGSLATYSVEVRHRRKVLPTLVLRTRRYRP